MAWHLRLPGAGPLGQDLAPGDPPVAEPGLDWMVSFRGFIRQTSTFRKHVAGICDALTASGNDRADTAALLIILRSHVCEIDGLVRQLSAFETTWRLPPSPASTGEVAAGERERRH